MRREVTRGGRRKEGSRSGWPSGATGCREAPEWPERAWGMRVARSVSQRLRPRLSAPSCAAAAPRLSRGRGDLLRQDPRGARATPPAPPSAPPLPAESLGRAGHGS